MVYMSRQTAQDEVKNAALEVLSQYKACTLATAVDGLPWASSVFFANEGLTLYLILEEKGKSMTNIRSNPKVALAIDDRIPDRFIQVAGVAELLEGSEAARARQVVYEKLPTYKPFFESVPTSMVRVRPKVLCVSDIPRGWFPAKIIAL